MKPVEPVELLDALGPRPKLALAARAPELVKCEPLGPKFSVVPLRSPSDRRLRGPHFHLLVALGGYANVYGRLYPSQLRLAADCNRSQPWVSRYMRDLVRFGYLRPLAARSKRRTSSRYQLMWTEHEERPPWEKLAPLDVPWPLREKARAEFLGEINSKVSTSRKESRHMAIQQPMTHSEALAYEKLLDAGQVPAPWKWKPDDANMKRERRYREFLGRIEAHSEALARYHTDGLWKRWKMNAEPRMSWDAARKWLRLGIDRKDAMAHIDRVQDEMLKAGKVPPDTLGKIPAPVREKVAA